MTFITCLLVTLFNIAVCIAFPKLLSLILAAKTNRTSPLQPELNPQIAESKVPSYL